MTALLCRTSDRDARGAAGADALARELAARRGRQPVRVGRPSAARTSRYDEDLRTARDCLLEAGARVEDLLDEGRYPLLCASDCSICVATLPALVRAQPDAWVLWLDAHPDFNSPETTPSGFLGGMCLAGACGVWDTGFGAGLDPERVLMFGVRDVDPGERELLDRHGVLRIERPSEVCEAVRGRTLYVHLDLDVLDPEILPAAFPAPGGLSDGGLRTLLAEVVGAADVVGAEITAFAAPERARRIATVVEPLLP